MAKIYLHEKEFCGAIRLVPNCVESRKFAALANKKCISPALLKRIIEQGYEVDIVKLNIKK